MYGKIWKAYYDFQIFDCPVMQHFLKKTIRFSLVLLVLLVALIHFVAPYVIIKPIRANKAISPEETGLDTEALDVLTRDGILLKGYLVHAEVPKPKGVMILIHGISGCKEHFWNLASVLADRGIDAYLFDGRAHGQSGGSYCTFGYNERFDIMAIVDELVERYPKMPIGVWGNSLGGAIALQALEVDPRIHMGIIESTFADLGQVVFDYKKRFLGGIGVRAISNYALKRAGKIAHFEPELVTPIESAKDITQPVFIAHGSSDQKISCQYGEALYGQLGSKYKQLAIVNGAGHVSLYAQGGNAFKQRLLSFIDYNLKYRPPMEAD